MPGLYGLEISQILLFKPADHHRRQRNLSKNGPNRIPTDARVVRLGGCRINRSDPDVIGPLQAGLPCLGERMGG